VFPISIPRELSALRFSSFISVIMSIFIVGVIFCEAILDHGTSEQLSDGFSKGTERASISAAGIFDSLPLIIFGFMYQMNVPAIYNELSEKSVQKGKKVLYLGTSLACIAYIIAGIFGFTAFASGTDLDTYKMIFDKQNILQAPFTLKNDDSKECLDYFINFYNDSICVTQVPIAIYVSTFGILFVVTMAAPFCVLPTKDSIEEVRGRPFTKVENFVWSFSLVAIPCLISIPIT
jgi:amino acid permease